MKKISYYFTNSKSTTTLLLFIVLLAALQIAHASGDSPQIAQSTSFPVLPDNNQQTRDNSNNPYETAQKFREYLKEKYKNISEANSLVRNTVHGPSGEIFVIGDIEPQRKPDLSKAKEKHERLRIIAKSFMEDEAPVFGNMNLDEVNEYNILDSTGVNGDYTIIYYRRYINDVELKDSELDIEVGQNENIKSFSARLVGVPPEVYKAAKEKTLSEREVRSIVEADLTADDKSGYDKLTKLESDSKGNDKIILRRAFKKIATTTPPYVIWEVYYLRYKYTIDAFTGKILDKTNTIISLVPRPSHTTTDQNTNSDTLPPMPPPILPQK